MMRSWRIGEAVLTGLAEYYGPVHVPATLYPDMDHQVLRDHRALMEGAFWIEAVDRLVIGIQVWVLRIEGKVILVDTGIGNGKTRTTPRANRLNTVFLEWLKAAGAGPEAVTDVVMTHLHSDHVGWNTVEQDGAWRPTFPNATYHIPRADYDWFKEAHRTGVMRDGGSFDDSVEPVVTAGLARFVEPGDIVAGCLEAVAAFGHTPGQLNYWLEAGGRRVVFAGDVLHHPVQVYRPDWNTIVDIEPQRAAETRAAFLRRAAAENALVLPCHFGVPHCGFIQERKGYAFQPAPPGSWLAGEATSPWESDGQQHRNAGGVPLQQTR